MDAFMLTRIHMCGCGALEGGGSCVSFQTTTDYEADNEIGDEKRTCLGRPALGSA